MQGICMVGLKRQHALVGGFGLLELALLLVGQTLLK
jgi:hypothetical protein